MTADIISVLTQVPDWFMGIIALGWWIWLLAVMLFNPPRKRRERAQDGPRI